MVSFSGTLRVFYRALVAVFAVVLVFAAATGFAFWRVSQSFSEIPRVETERTLSAPPPPASPVNILVVGVDSAAGLQDGDPRKAGRDPYSMLADAILVVRVDPAEKSVRLLSIPRDLWLPVNGDMGKINSALASGGPPLLIETIKTELGIPVNHFVQVDFAGFESVVESLGGVRIQFNYPARDVRSGLNVPFGCVTLSGSEALAFSRSRFYEFFDDGWQSDPSGDFGRTSRQRTLLLALGSQSRGLNFADALAFKNIFDEVSQHVALDETFSLSRVWSLANHFRNVVSDDVESLSLPGFIGTVGPASVVFLDDTLAPGVLSRFGAVGQSVPQENVDLQADVRGFKTTPFNESGAVSNGLTSDLYGECF